MPIPAIESLEHLCPNVSSIVIQDFLDRMDPEYFEEFTLKTTSLHIRLAAQLTPHQPCALHTHKDKQHYFTLHIVAYDYFSEFSTICGILSSFGLDIREAFIFTYSNHPSSSKPVSPSHIRFQTKRSLPLRSSSTLLGLSKKKVVDVFRLHLLPEFSFTPKHQTELRNELTTVIQFLDKNQFRQARNRVNRGLG